MVVTCLILVAIAAFSTGTYWVYQEVKTAKKQQSTDEIIRLANIRLVAIEAKKKEPVYISLPGAGKNTGTR
jgi:anionic cell wall polymer biosynthesis LytR-Cps2A-Psr (LCP) family protein